MRKTSHNNALTNKKRVISTIGQGGRPDILKLENLFKNK